MKIAIFLLSLSLGCSLHAFAGNAAVEQIEHHQQQVEVSDNPEICIDCHANQADRSHHPIAVSYPPEGKKELFLSAATLPDNRISLFKGQVVCTSCHDLKNPGSSHLVTDNTNSKLCLLCHRK